MIELAKMENELGKVLFTTVFYPYTVCNIQCISGASIWKMLDCVVKMKNSSEITMFRYQSIFYQSPYMMSTLRPKNCKVVFSEKCARYCLGFDQKYTLIFTRQDTLKSIWLVFLFARCYIKEGPQSWSLQCLTISHEQNKPLHSLAPGRSSRHFMWHRR